MTEWNWTAIGAVATVASAIVTAVLAAATFWMVRLTGEMAKATSDMAYLSERGLDAEEQREKSRRTPFVLVDFSDGPDHENLGAVGFRYLQSKLELIISGTIRNVGNALAVDIRLDVFQFSSSDATPVHEISSIHVADAIPAGGTSQWSKSIGLTELTVAGTFYQSGISGLFSADSNNKYHCFDVVFSCKNTDGEDFYSVYCMEKIIRENKFEGNKMTFRGASDKYDQMKRCS